MVCASTGNTAASAAAYAARAGLRGAVIVPEGKIATGKLAQALMHGARVIALRGNFDEALALVRELADRHPIALVNSVNDYRIEGQKTGAFEVCDAAGRGARRALHPGGQRRQRDRRGGAASRRTARRRALHGYQAEGAAPLVHGAPVEQPETVASAIRIGNPARWEDAMNAFTASRGEVRAVTDERDPRRLHAARPRARACSASRPRRRRWPGCSSTAPRAGWCACSPATGSRTRRPR